MGSSAGTSTAVHVHPSGPLLSLRQRWQLLAVSGPGRSSVWPSAENEPGVVNVLLVTWAGLEEELEERGGCSF